eukprot:jgi/Tetstr1/464009/TSEL_008814.t1
MAKRPARPDGTDPALWAVSTLDVVLRISHAASERDAVNALRGFVRDPATEATFREFSRRTRHSPPHIASAEPDPELTEMYGRLLGALVRAFNNM